MSAFADRSKRRRPLENSQPERPAVVGSLTEVARVQMDETGRLLAALRPARDRYLAKGHRESLALLKAIRLAPSLEVCEALLRGEPVPLSRLDPDWAKAYGLL